MTTTNQSHVGTIKLESLRVALQLVETKLIEGGDRDAARHVSIARVIIDDNTEEDEIAFPMDGVLSLEPDNGITVHVAVRYTARDGTEFATAEDAMHYTRLMDALHELRAEKQTFVTQRRVMKPDQAEAWSSGLIYIQNDLEAIKRARRIVIEHLHPLSHRRGYDDVARSAYLDALNEPENWDRLWGDLTRDADRWIKDKIVLQFIYKMDTIDAEGREWYQYGLRRADATAAIMDEREGL